MFQAFFFARKSGAVLMNRLLVGRTWLDNSRRDVATPYNTKADQSPTQQLIAPDLCCPRPVLSDWWQLCTADSMYPDGQSSLPVPHYLQLGPRQQDQVLTFAVITFNTGATEKYQPSQQL